jgi:hypothetical protein
VAAVPFRVSPGLVVMRTAKIVAALAAIVCALWYLRDPAWLIDQNTGLRQMERAGDGRNFRWSGGHSSFFVPSAGRTVRIPLSTTFDARGTEPMVVSVFVDDVRAARVLLTDDAWHDVTVPLPPAGSRRVRRIDIRTSVVREDNHGVRVGEARVSGLDR